VKARAPGKVMLFGEYIALEGHPSVLVAVDRYADACVGQQPPARGRRSWMVESPDASLAGVNALCEALRLSGWYTVDTSDFLAADGVKLGLGSSAAALASLAALAAPHLDATQRFILARDAHNRSQREVGSGADVATSTFGGLLLYQKEPFFFERLSPSQLGISLLCVETGLAASTTDLVGRVSAHRQKASVEALFQQMSETSHEAIRAIRSKDALACLSSLSRYGRLVQALGQETNTALWLDCHEEVEKLAQELGGCAKPSGAGGGDLVLVALPSENEATMRHRLQQEGWRCLSLQLSLTGSTTEEQIKTAPLIL
jgi:phosphomevalonate kinase